jgi:hypothetical protein
MAGPVLKNLRMFKNLCGSKAMPSVVIATTMWDEVTTEEGEQREQELKRYFWTEMVADACMIERFEGTYDSAWRIIGTIMQKNLGTTLLIQEEMGNVGKALHKTSAGVHANDKTRKVSPDFMRLFRSLFGE